MKEKWKGNEKGKGGKEGKNKYARSQRKIDA
jgi:hypothetical protein